VKKKQRRKAAPGFGSRGRRKPTTRQAVDSAALEDIARLWKLTEQVMQHPLSADEQASVAKVRRLLFSLAEDLAGQYHPRLSEAQSVKLTQELKALLGRPPFDQFDQSADV